jgi:tetratricopeptide (TPR) repeat protein
MGRDPAAEQVLERAAKLQQELAEQYPDELHYRGQLAGALHNRAEIILARGDREGARKLFEQALALQRAVYKANPRLQPYPRYLRNHCRALTDVHLRSGDHAAAAAAAEEMPTTFPYDQAEYRRAAGALTRCMLLAVKDAKLTDEQRQGTARKYADRAVVLVDKAIRRGFEDVKFLKTFEAYAPLRQHAGFAKLVADLEKRQLKMRLDMALGNLRNGLNIATGAHDLEFLADHAEFSFRRAVTLLGELVADYPTDSRYQLLLGGAHESLGEMCRTLGRGEQATAAFRQAAQVYDKLADEHSLALSLAIAQGTAYRHLHEFLKDNDKAQAVLDRYSRVLATAAAVLQKAPNNAAFKERLAQMYANRAWGQTEIGRLDAALRDWDRALNLAAGPLHDDLFARRLLTLARRGDHQRVNEEAAKLASKANLAPTVVYNLACAYSVASAAALKESERKAAEREKLGKAYAERAVELLARAQRVGFFRTPGMLAHLKRDPDLDPLRQHARLQQLVREAEAEKRRQQDQDE